LKNHVDEAQDAGGVNMGQVFPGSAKFAAFAPDRLTLLMAIPAVPVFVNVTD
jgi:hypothetical protein